MKKRLLTLLAAPLVALGVVVAVPGVASATSLSGLGAPPVNNTNCWERQGFGFTEVNCQWGTPYNYAQQLYAPWINSGQVLLHGSYWPTAAGQPSGTSAWHDDWNTNFLTVDTATWTGYQFLSSYYNNWLYAGENGGHPITICLTQYSDGHSPGCG